jgi:rRNA-processing protein FCF1
MSSVEFRSELGRTSRLLIDTNLLVLYTVGNVNRGRISTFKRTRQYGEDDFDLLLRAISCFKQLYTVAHVLAEVSNLTDLAGEERQLARRVLKEAIGVLQEPVMASSRAAQEPIYDGLGLVDSSILAVARKHRCAVLTDDLDLYLALCRQKVPAVNFTHLRARRWGV